jgi:SAM-dependent methyltransferase
MSVATMQTRSPETYVERLVADLGSAIGVLTVEAGSRAGLWQALAGAGPTTAAQLADRTGASGPLVREWLREQAAAGYLDYDPLADAFTLTDEAAGALLHGPGLAMVAACTEMFGPIIDGLDAYVDALRSGSGVGWHQRGSRFWHGSDALTQVALPAPAVAAVLDAAGASERLASGGVVLDVGCGFGSPTLAIAAHLPAATVIGIDYNEGSFEAAQERAVAAGVSDRVRFARATAAEIPPAPHPDGYSLITFVDCLHDFGDPVGALVAARGALAPEGRVLVIEAAAGDDLVENLHPLGRMFYAVSTLICTPNAVTQRVDGGPEPLGTLAGPAALTRVAEQAGFTDVRRVPVELPMNLVLELGA